MEGNANMSGPGYKRRLAGDITERRAYITWFGHRIAILTERMNDATETEYIIEVLWDEYFRCGCKELIEGIDMERHPREFYIRDHIPYFVKMRVPPPGREDIPEILERFGLKEYDTWDLLIAFKGNTNGDMRVEEIKEVKSKVTTI